MDLVNRDKALKRLVLGSACLGWRGQSGPHTCISGRSLQGSMETSLLTGLVHPRAVTQKNQWEVRGSEVLAHI